MHTLHGIDPFTGEAAAVSTGLRDREAQRALTWLLGSANYFAVREALLEAGRGDLIGGGATR